VVNLMSAGAFDFPDNTLTVSAKLGQNRSGSAYGGNEPIGEAGARWAKRFGAADEFGILVAASYWSRHLHVPQIETGSTLNWYGTDGKRAATAYAGNGYAVPAERRWYNYDNQRDRSGLTARIDWQPEGPLSGQVAAYGFKQHEDSDRYTQVATVNAASTVTNQTPTSGTLNSVNQLVELGRLRWQRALYGVNGELKAEWSSGWAADVRASTSRSTVSNPQTWERFTQSNLPFNYDWSGQSPTFTAVNAASAADASRYALNYHREEATQYAQRVQDLQANARYNMAEASRGLGAAMGVRLVDTRMDTSFARTNWTGMPYTLADVLGSSSLCGFNCNTPLLLIDPGRADAAFATNRSTAATTIDTAAQFGGTYAVNEKVNAAYAQAQYRADRWLIVGGFRLEDARVSTNGFTLSGTTWSPVSASHSDREFLPSLVAVYDTSETSKFRMGASQTLGRPRFDQLATRGGVLSTSTNPPTQSQGNAELKPRRSSNFDLSHDWYLDNGRGIFSAALFHKIVSDEIFTFGQLQTLTVNGTPTPVLVTQARNVAGKVKLTGLEFGITKDIDFLTPALKGFGVSANASFIRSTYPVTLTNGSTTELSALPQQPKQLWNLALYYERGPLHAKLAWNHVGKLWDDRFPNYTAAGFYANRYQQATDNVDFQFSYDVSKRLSISLDLLNITSQGQQYNFGSSQEYLQSAWKIGPSVLVGLNLKF
ncbi:TonB-dependent receptor, partial [Pelomonas sp. HMWF004]